ncbi:MAG: hypothetical protein DCF32_00380 [Leptolyngbya sp.]|nr:MAG: hypothetical protein DCF32_00380 [Leptolyngbya sp.]
MAAVLIVEVNADLADTLQACVHAAGCTSYWAQTGEQGLELCQQLEPDIIVLDWNLPGMDGIEVCTHVRQMELRRYPYILVLSAQWGEDYEAGALNAGADMYMTKPFAPNLLIVRLQGLIRRGQLHLRREQGQLH